MTYTRDYYGTLGLRSASGGSSGRAVSTAEVRRAYKFALLAAHPDKKSGAAGNGNRQVHTVDEVKEAYTILANEKSKADYDTWVLHNPQALGARNQELQVPSSDFILGLELLDLSDFDVLDPTFSFSQPPSQASTSTDANGREAEGEGEGQMEWTRACRCGAEKGFRIMEEELEDAESRGEKEVLVGCEGCSLWVRVAFDVEEG